MEMTKLKKKRIEKGMSQCELSEASGVNVRTIQQYEQGNRKIEGCNLKSMINLSKALDCKVVDIIDDSNLVEAIKKADFN